VTVRSRLTLAFTYILLTVIVALSIPLAINLDKRARSEYATETLTNVQTVAGAIGAESLQADQRAKLQRDVESYARELSGRVVVTNRNGFVLADSDRTEIGDRFAEGLRPEIDIALGNPPTPNWQYRHSTDANADLLVTAAPIIDEGLVGAVRLTTNVHDVSRAVRRTELGIAVIGLGGLLAGVLIAAALAGSLARPLQRLAAAARRLGSGDLTARAGAVEGASEVEELGRSFDEMASRLERTVQAQREFVANASHQLRTPLTGMKLRLESAIDAVTDGSQRHQLEAAEREVDRLSEIVDRLLVMAKQIEEGEPTHVDLGESVHRAVDRWSDRASRLGSTLDASGPSAIAQVNPSDLDQILDNLLDNALAYAPGPIEVQSGLTDGIASVAVRDHGTGIPAEEQARVVERFYRGRGAPRGGSGLGLAITRELAEKWGGRLRLQQADGGGTRVDVTFHAAWSSEDEGVGNEP
jgi:two-component system, OmpR family, sensor kinase